LTPQELRYWETPEYRAKYTDDDRKTMAKSGEAMPDGSYPIKDKADLDNAIHAVGRGGSDHDAIRKHIIARAHALGAPDAIPDNWGADGSLKDDNTAPRGLPPASTNPALTKAAERRKERHRATPLGREVRFFAPTQVEVRASQDGPEIVIEGAAVVYGAAYRVVDFFGEFRETIHAGAATNIVDGVDCRLLFNHDGLPMARTTSGTMSLIDTPNELRFRASLDARQQLANDFAIAIERGDLSQMSIGMVVNRDKWGNDGGMETRDIYGLADLPDVSGVTYPCSPTTHIEVARRMVMAAPLESRARLRQMEVQLRAGKVLSAGSQSKLVAALAALHDLADAGGVDTSQFGPNSDEEETEVQTHSDGTEGGSDAETDNGIVYLDGSGARGVAPESAAERRDQSMSYGDRESAVYEALLTSHGDGDGDSDLWVQDMSDSWVVYQSYLAPMGLFRCSYTIDNDGAVSLLGDPEPVQAQTAYVPVQQRSDTARMADDGCPHHDDEGDVEEQEGEPEGLEAPEGDAEVEHPAPEEAEAEPRRTMKASTLRLLNEAGRRRAD